MITYCIGDATAPRGSIDDVKVIVHCCNDVGGWGAGFVKALEAKWPILPKRYRAWHRVGHDFNVDFATSPTNFEIAYFQLGGIQLVPVAEDIIVCNLIGQHDIMTDEKGKEPIRYWAINEGLKMLDNLTPSDWAIHMPRMGCGLAGGTWGEMEKIITDVLGHRSVTVYDLPTEEDMVKLQLPFVYTGVV